MKWSLKLAQVAGIGIYVHWTFLILVGWIVLADVANNTPLDEAIEGLVFVLALFGCVVLHELGHALTAQRFGVRTRDITLLPIGGVARLERIPEVPIQEFWVAVAGPAVNVVIAAVLAAVIVGQGESLGPWTLSVAKGHFLNELMVVNVALFLFNLLPAFPMDGGRVLRALLAHFTGDYVRATQTAASVGQALAIMLGFFGLLQGNPFLMFIALFVYVGAQEEAHQVEVRSVFRGVPVRQAMMTRVRSLSPETTLAAASDELLAGEQHDFPIVADGRVLGMLVRAELIQALAEKGPQARVADVMRTDCATVEDTEMLEATFQRMRDAGCSTLPVVHAGAFAGLVTLENVGELAMIHSALRQARARSAVDDIYRAG